LPFFFSSRRRHTRFSRDWSSDVCSSDLGKEGQPLASAIFGDYTALVYLMPIFGGIAADRWLGRRAALIAGGAIMALGHFLMAFRSEERRVGKEGRARWSPERLKT